MRYGRLVLGIGVAMVLMACGGSNEGSGTPSPSSSGSAEKSASPQTSTDPDTDLAAGTVAYLKAWAANDVATMIRNSAPGSPARHYASYWGDVYAAGRLDSGSARLTVRRDSATLTYPEGAAYRMAEFENGPDGLVTWSARPGGPLAPRIVADAPVSVRVGGLRVTSGIQYVNSDSSLRISVRVSNPGEQRRDIETPVYTSPDGRRSTASIGSGGRTGVVPVKAGSRMFALVSAADASVGGRLQIKVYDAAGQPRGVAVMLLPG